MKRSSFTVAAGILILCANAYGDIYKCTAADGSSSFASVPCAHGTIDRQRSGPPPIARKGEPVNLAHQLNLNATEILKLSGRTRVIVVESDAARQNQKNRPHPPSVPSICERPQYESNCFDPSGGQSNARIGRQP